MPETLFSGVLTTSISMSLILAPLLLLSPKLNRVYHVKWKYYLWLLIAVRMLVPFQLPLVPSGYAIELPDYLLPADHIISATFFAAPQSPAPYYAISALSLLAAVWLTGAVAVAFFHIASYRHCKKAYMRWSIRCRDQNILTRAEAIRKQMHIRKLPEISICARAAGPVILGVFRPHLLLPHSRYGHADLDYILRHELIHWKRGDIWYKLLLLAVVSVHWFNPLSHLLLRRAAEDLEMLCDNAVIRGRARADCKRYGEVILKAAREKPPHPTLLSTNFYGGIRTLKSRLHNILSPGKRSGTATYLGACAAAILVSSAVICLPVRASMAAPLRDKTIQIPNGIRGIDVSAFQGDVNWEQVADHDVHFTFVRASYGLEADAVFAQNAAEARRNGLDVGAWHYATFTDRETMLRQADFFLTQIDAVELTLPAVLCIDAPTGLSRAETTSLCIEFLDIVSHAGYPVAINTHSTYLETYLDADRLQDVPKWIANYTDEPQVGQQFWQYTSSGAVEGIEGPVDMNVAYAGIA